MPDDELQIANLTDWRLIAHGGFSVVYAATNTQFDRPVAVKVLNRLSSESDQRRFERECRVMGRLSTHPNVVNVHSAGYTQDGRPYIEMELIEGGTLAERIKRDGPIPWQQAAGYMIAVSDALGVAHAAEILHRDVKPENILLSGDQPRLTDFGIAYLRDSTGATSTHISASWLHSPPETFENERDIRSDLYSLGSTLHTAIVGTPPFWRSTDESLSPLMYRLLNEQPPRIPAELAPAPLADFVVRSLSKDPNERPQTTAEFGGELQRILAGSPGGLDPSGGSAGPLGAAPTIVSGDYAPPTGQPGQTQFVPPAHPDPSLQATNPEPGYPEATTPSPPVVPSGLDQSAPPAVTGPGHHQGPPIGPPVGGPDDHQIQGLAAAPTMHAPVQGQPPTMHAPVQGQPPTMHAPVQGQPPTTPPVSQPTNLVGPPGSPPGAQQFAASVPPVGSPPTGFAPPEDAGGSNRGRVLLAVAVVVFLGLLGGAAYLATTVLGDDVPQAVTALTVTEADSQLTIEFTEPAGPVAESFEVSVNDGDWEPLPVSRQLTGLTNGTSYSVRVRGVNSDGPGDPGSASAEVTPYGPPRAPSVTASVGGGTISWAWSEPEGNGRPISGYWVQFDDGEQVFQTGTGFTPGAALGPLEEHRLTVWAVNGGDDDDRNTSGPETVSARTNGSATSVLVQTIDASGDNGIVLVREPQTVEHGLGNTFAWRVSCQFLGPEYVSVYWQIETRLDGEEIVVDITERLRYDAVDGQTLFADMCELDEQVNVIDQKTETLRFPIADGVYDLEPSQLSGAGAVNDSTNRQLTITLTP